MFEELARWLVRPYLKKQPPFSHYEERAEDLMISAAVGSASRFSRGNVTLQSGDMILDRDIDAVIKNRN